MLYIFLHSRVFLKLAGPLRIQQQKDWLVPLSNTALNNFIFLYSVSVSDFLHVTLWNYTYWAEPFTKTDTDFNEWPVSVSVAARSSKFSFLKLMWEKVCQCQCYPLGDELIGFSMRSSLVWVHIQTRGLGGTPERHYTAIQPLVNQDGLRLCLLLGSSAAFIHWSI